MKMTIRFVTLAATAALFAGCHGMHHHDGMHEHHGMGGARAELKATQGNTAAGTVHFMPHGDKLHVHARVTGLTPGQHGFHIHEKGDCSAPDATSAGGHFNPTGAAHGHPHQGPHHAGDLPALEADASGKADLHAEIDGVTLADGPNSIVGRGLIVHAAPDDFKTQPTGNSGARVACGVIAKMAK